jgi:hypothetical protein
VTESNLLTNKVNIQLNMLGAVMMNGVGGEVDGGDVVIKKTTVALSIGQASSERS